MLKSIITNPLIIACILGGGINYLDFTLPIITLNLLKILSASALPMGLLSIGFSLDLSSVKEAKAELIISFCFETSSYAFIYVFNWNFIFHLAQFYYLL